MVGRSASPSAGRSLERTPASYAPRAPAPATTNATEPCSPSPRSAFFRRDDTGRLCLAGMPPDGIGWARRLSRVWLQIGWAEDFDQARGPAKEPLIARQQRAVEEPGQRHVL